MGCGEMSPEEVEQVISKSEKLSKIDRVCKSLAKPGDFVELKKQIFGNAGRSAITYQYRTSRTFDQVAEHFKNECEKTNCSVLRENNDRENSLFRTLDLKIEGVEIGIEYRPSFASLINFGCSM